jgi:hypothetical protein
MTAFQPRQDILRGVFQVVQSTLGFAFMLAIMYVSNLLIHTIR